MSTQVLSPPTTTSASTSSSPASRPFPRSQSFTAQAPTLRSKTLSTPTPPSFLYTYSSYHGGLSDLAGYGSEDETTTTTDRRLRSAASSSNGSRPSRSGHPLVQSRTMPLRELTDDEEGADGRRSGALRRSRKETLPADYWARAKSTLEASSSFTQPLSSSSSTSTTKDPHQAGGPTALSRSRSSTLVGPLSGGGSSSSTQVGVASSSLVRRPTLVEQLEAKIVFLGSPSVGKTSIIQRFTTRRFAPSTKVTVGTGLSTRKQTVDGVQVRLQLWDAAGQERYRSIAPMYYRGAHVAILVYDVTNRQSFDDLKSWLAELKENVSADVIIHVVGAKADLAKEKRVDLATARRELRLWLLPSPPTTPTLTLSTPSASTPTMTTPSSTTTTPVRPSLALPTTSRLTFVNPLRPALPSPTKESVTALGPADDESKEGTSFLYGRGRRRSGDWAAGFGMDPPATAGSAEEGLRRKSEEWSRRAGGSVERKGVSFRSEDRDGARGRKKVEVEEEDDGLEGIKVWETSSSTSQGIEDLFLHITRQLIARGDQLEHERLRKARESVMLDEPDALETTKSTGKKDKTNKFGGGCCV